MIYKNSYDISNFKKENLKIYLNNVLKMGRIVQGMFYKFKDAYFEKDKNLCDEIIQQDDRLDFLETKLEYEGLSMLGSQNFTGIYLKATMLGIKMSYIFENMGDLCEENAKLNLEILKLPQLVNMLSFEDIFSQSQKMFSLSLKLLSNFVNLDIQKLTEEDSQANFFLPAKEICFLNQEVNSLLAAFKKNLYRSKEKIKTISLHLNVLSNIEKFSDFSTNIAENVLWALTGNKFKCRETKLEYFYSYEEES
jgi:phosphate transport system protein